VDADKLRVRLARLHRRLPELFRRSCAKGAKKRILWRSRRKSRSLETLGRGELGKRSFPRSFAAPPLLFPTLPSAQGPR
jgi:hypothetical protein